ncbi:FUSC family protein [Streptomyces sp. NPDC047028]|uniref:FUSC family protein n=1 Tax=Streptomyces sp. NPDC047028 TaxID=3155793 RepID=UPI0033D42D15
MSLYPTDENLLAPLTALLVVQVSVFETMRTGLRRVGSVVAGVLLAMAFSMAAGLTWWSLGVVVIISLLCGHVLRVGEFAPEVAISGMLVLGVADVSGTAANRIVETCIGAVTGVFFSLLTGSSTWMQPARQAVPALASEMRHLLGQVAAEWAHGAAPERKAAWGKRAHRIHRDIGWVDKELALAERTRRLHPGTRDGSPARLRLRSGLDSLRSCASAVQTLCNALAWPYGPDTFSTDFTARMREVLLYLGDALEAFGLLLSAPGEDDAVDADQRLRHLLARASEGRAALAGEHRARVTSDAATKQLHSTVLACIDSLIRDLRRPRVPPGAA